MRKREPLTSLVVSFRALEKDGSATVPWTLSSAMLGDRVLELGPGPGLTTDLLRQWVNSLTAIEIDPTLADSLGRRLGGSNVRVVVGDATEMPFPDEQFSAVVSCTIAAPFVFDRIAGSAVRSGVASARTGRSFCGQRQPAKLANANDPPWRHARPHRSGYGCGSACVGRI